MRGVGSGMLAICLAPLLIAVPAWADASDYYGPAGTQCTITDPRIDELSGLVVLPSGDMLVVEDSTPEPRPGSTSILMFGLTAACAVQGGPEEFALDPRDIEDLAFRDNTVWFADIGDNGVDRQNVALIAVSYDPALGQRQVPAPHVFRFAYPDGPHDAEALLLAPNGTPYIVTKDLLGRSGVYRPGAPLDSTGEVLLVKVGDVEFGETGTPGGPVGRAGQVLVTGGAVAADGTHLALRTYTDAYLWPLSGSDVAGALGSDPLAVVALPDAPQGEAISFAADSRSLVVGGEGVGSVITAVPAVPSFGDTEPDATTRADGEAPASSLGTAGLPSRAGLIVAVVGATVLIWLIGRLRRKPGPGMHGH